jgi:hypothetical protein
MDRPARILYVVEDMWGCAWYRAHVPGMELIRRGHEVVLHERIHEPSVEMCDILVFQRRRSRSGTLALRARG